MYVDSCFKTKPVSDLMEATTRSACFWKNKSRNGTKWRNAKGYRWHMISHVQRNKVKYGTVRELIHAVDSLKL